MLSPAMTNPLLWLVLLLLPSLLLSSVSAKVFVSIDCGSTLSSYTDKHGIEWVGDSLYTKHGETRNVFLPKTYEGWDASHVMSTLRVFTTRRKNCYTIAADKGERVLIRTSFFYGNYDNKSFPPAFDILVDGNMWGGVVTKTVKPFLSYEAAYTVKGKTLSFCLAQALPDQFPFISSLEVRSLDTGMYSYIDPNYPLFFGWRYAMGATGITRYPEDDYDRLWDPVLLEKTDIRVTSDSPRVLLDDAEDNPPTSAMRTALTILNISGTNLSFSGDSAGYPSPFYFNMYFSEVSKLNSTQKRSFLVKVNNNAVNNGLPISPPYGKVLELRIPNVTASKNTVIDLVRTSDSTLPPIFNALEMVYVAVKQTEGTDPIDVNTLAVLQKSFIQLQDWTGDPCLPFPYTWDWVGCSSAIDNPRITALYLSSFGLVGTLPDFSGLDALEIIDLHNNSLVQEFPDFLGSFPLLKKLNVSYNNFSGTVPPSLLENPDLSLDVTGNPHLQCRSNNSCVTGTEQPSPTTPQSSGNSKLKSTNMPAIILIGTFQFLFMFFGSLC